MLLTDDVPSLLAKVTAEIDDIGLLNARHEGAYTAAGPLFDWSARGRELLKTMQYIKASASASGLDDIDLFTTG